MMAMSAVEMGRTRIYDGEGRPDRRKIGDDSFDRAIVDDVDGVGDGTHTAADDAVMKMLR